MMPEFFQRWMTQEVYKHPGVFLSGILIAAVVGGMSLNPFVMAEDFRDFRSGTNDRLGKLEAGVCQLQFTTDRNALETQARAVSTEIFQLERLEKAGEATDRDRARLYNLRNDAENLKTRLNVLMRDTDCPDLPANYP